MIFSCNDTQKLKTFYDDLIVKNGPHTVQSLGWNNEYTQQIRFAILSQVFDLNNKSILDVGCWFGDLYSFLQERYHDFTYTGIDILSSMVDRAQINHPDIPFVKTDFNSYESDNFDIIFASGSLSCKIPNARERYFGMIKKMFEKSTIALAFNVLDRRHHPDDDDFIAYTLPEVYEFCSHLTDKIIIRQDYLPYDMTFYLYHTS